MTLELREAALLVDALKAPPGMDIAAAVGTTYTLDLASLLAIPVAASFTRAMTPDEEEPASLLETIRRYADATVLFCQAGAISVPPSYRAAMTFVEESVVEIRKPKGGIFHPKVWAVRFEGGGRQSHRILVMSRNLTFDRALDVIVRLDEDPETTNNVDVAELVQLLRDLPSQNAARPVVKRQRDLVASLADSLGAARFAAPAPFDSGKLLVGRPGKGRQPFHKSCDHALGVSPFLTENAVKRFVATADTWVGIVSRREALDRVANALADVEEVLRVKDVVLNAQESADVVLSDTVVAPEVSDAGAEPSHDPIQHASTRGLHAKLYVQDVGSRSTVWLGSANLTTPGFGGNFETLVQLEGPKRLVGVDALLDPARRRRDLSMLVEDHVLAETPPAAVEDEQEITEFEGLALELASAQVDVALAAQSGMWQAELLITPWPRLEELTASARLLSLKEGDFVTVDDGAAQWNGLDLTAITPFVVLRLQGPSRSRTMLVRANLTGDPPHRRGAILARAIRSPEDFLRYLAALLGHPDDATPPDDPGHGLGDRSKWLRGLRADRILEDLLTTVARAPKRLDTLHETLLQLDAHPETRDYVSDEFREVWRSVRAALARRRA